MGSSEGAPVSDEIHWCAKYQTQSKPYACAESVPVLRMLFEVCNFVIYTMERKERKAAGGEGRNKGDELSIMWEGGPLAD